MPAILRSPQRNRFWISVLTFLVIGYALVVLWKQVWLKRPQGDFGVYARAGWAIRQGQSTLYHVQDDNTWHYNYPPTFALFLTPFADPPRRDVALTTAIALGCGGAPLPTLTTFAACPNPMLPDHGWYLPYWISSLTYYLLNVVCLYLAVHLLVGALSQLVPPSPDPEETNRRWWWWRIAPSVACAPVIGLNLMRGQVQIFLLILLVGMLVDLLQGRRFRAGLCLAAAITLKIFPAYLLIVPLVRRDLRCLSGSVVGLLIGLIVLPTVVLGLDQTAHLYHDYGTMMLGPAMSIGVNHDRADELLNATSTQSQSFQAILHKTLHLFAPSIPKDAATWIKVVHLSISGALTLLVLRSGRGLRQAHGMELATSFALLTALMVLICPVCHLHYLVLVVPLTTLMIVQWEIDQPHSAHLDKWALSTMLVLTMALPMVPGLGMLRNVGLPLLGVLVWWFLGLSMRWQTQKSSSPIESIRSRAA